MVGRRTLEDGKVDTRSRADSVDSVSLSAWHKEVFEHGETT